MDSKLALTRLVSPPLSPGSWPAVALRHISRQLDAALAHRRARSWLHCCKINGVVLDHLSRRGSGEGVRGQLCILEAPATGSGGGLHTERLIRQTRETIVPLSGDQFTCRQSLGLELPTSVQKEGNRHRLASRQVLLETLRPAFVPGQW